MRQVGEAELIYKIVSALRKVRPATWKEAANPRHEIKSRAVASIATVAGGALRDLEVLSGAPFAPDATFTRPLARMLGEEMGSGAPVMD